MNGLEMTPWRVSVHGYPYVYRVCRTPVEDEDEVRPRFEWADAPGMHDLEEAKALAAKLNGEATAKEMPTGQLSIFDMEARL